MKEFIIQYWVETILVAITGVITALYKKLSRKVHKQISDQDAVKAGTMALLRSELVQNYEKYMNKGYLPLYATENILELFNNYHKLGGNGAVDKLMSELMELPSIEQK